MVDYSFWSGSPPSSVNGLVLLSDDSHPGIWWFLILLLSFTKPEPLVASQVAVFQTDDTLVFSDNQFFVWLEEEIIADTLISLLEEFNAVQIWDDDDIGLALWQVNSFPFITGDGQEIAMISEAILRAKQKTKIKDATFNIEIQSDTLQPLDSPVSCFDPVNFAKIQGETPIKISILDTGISDISDNSTSNFNYQLQSYTGYDYVRSDDNPDDENGHGTFVTGLIHSIVHGSTPDHLNRVSFDIRKTHDAAGRAFMSALVIATYDAINVGANIINMSFGYSDAYADSIFFPLKLLIQKAQEEDVLIVAAAGNDFLNNDDPTATALPASFPLNNIISVGSVGCDSSLSFFSNFGARSVDLLSLGEQIPGPDLGAGIRLASGTSHAAAIVSASVALLGTQLEVFNPQLVKCALQKTALHRVSLADLVNFEGIMNFDSIFSITTNCNLSLPCLTSFTGLQALQGPSDSHKMIETNLIIESQQVIGRGHHVTYDSAMSSLLGPGFEVSEGGNFQILIDGCNQ